MAYHPKIMDLHPPSSAVTGLTTKSQLKGDGINIQHIKCFTK